MIFWRHEHELENTDQNGEEDAQPERLEDPAGLRHCGCIRNVENAANRKLRTNGHLFLNEVIDMLDPYGKGCHRTAVGQVAGWIYDPKDETKQNCVSLGTHCYVPGNEALNDFINGDERSVMLHFNCDGPIIDKI